MHRPLLLFVFLLWPLDGAAWTGTVIHLNAWHSQFDQYAALKHRLNEERQSSPNPTLVFSSGDAFGDGPDAGVLLGERSSVLALGQLVDADTLGNNNFDVGLDPLETLIAAADYATSCVNIVRGIHNVSRCARFGSLSFCGVFIDIDFQRVNPAITRQLEIISARQGAALARLQELQQQQQQQSQPFLVAAMNYRRAAHAPEVSAAQYAAQVFPGYHLVLFGSEGQIALQRAHAQAPYVVASVEAGLGYTKVFVEDNRVVGSQSVSVGADDVSVPSARLQLEIWNELASTKRSEVVTLSDSVFLGRSFTREARTRHVFAGDNALATMIARSYALAFGADFGIINSGGVRTDFPVVTDVNQTAPYPVVAGDCLSVSPFGSFLAIRNVTGAQLWAIAEWAVRSVPGYVNAHFWGLRWSAELPAGTVTSMHAVHHHSGDDAAEDVVAIPRDNRTYYTLALSEFLAFGGDRFPVLGDTDDSVLVSEIRDNQAICSLMRRSEGIAWAEHAGMLSIVRTVAEMRPNEALAVGRQYVMPISNDTGSGYGASLTLQPRMAEQFSVTRGQLSSFGHTLTSNEFAVVFKGVKLVGQLYGDPLVISTGSGTSVTAIEVCCPVRADLELETTFTELKFGKRQSFASWTIIDSPVVLRDDLWLCVNISLDAATFRKHHDDKLVLSPIRVGLGGSFLEYEMILLTVLGTLYALILLAAMIVFSRNVIEQCLQPNYLLKNLLNAGYLLRCCVVLISLLRALYFLMLPWGLLDADRVSATFMFEICLALDLAVVSVVCFLFLSLFRYKENRFKSAARLHAPLVVLNLVVLLCFIIVLAVWGSSTDPFQRRAVAFAYRIVVAVISILMLFALCYWGIRLSYMILFTLHEKPQWMSQLRRFAFLASVWGLGLAGIVIVMIYQMARPFDAISESVPFLFVFLLLFECFPLITVIIDLDKATARYVNVVSESERETPRLRKRLQRRMTISELKQTSGRSRANSLTHANERREDNNEWLSPHRKGSGGTANIPDTDSVDEPSSSHYTSQVESQWSALEVEI